MATRSKSFSVELRIHGVSGTPPQDMLGSEHVRQVAGDDRGRFFRPCGSDQTEIQSDPERVLEGYHWGEFTAGTWRQGLWLVLIPFGFVNAAAFMLPGVGSAGRLAKGAHTSAGALIRLIGIGQTCTLSLASSLIFVDLLASHAQRSAWLGDVPDRLIPALAAAAAALVMTGLFLLGRQAGHQPLFTPPGTSMANTATGAVAAETPGRGDGQSRRGAVGLCRPQFYGGELHAPTLSRLHLIAGLAVVALVVSLKADQAFPSTSVASLWPVIGGLVAVTALVTAVLGDPEGSTVASVERERWHRAVSLASWVGLAVVTVLLVAVVMLWPGKTLTEPVAYEGMAAWLVYAMTAVMASLLLVNGLLAYATRADRRAIPAPFRPYAAGMAAWATSSVGVFLGIGYSAAAVLATANALEEVAPSPLIFRVAHAWGLTAVLVVGVALTCALLAVGRVSWSSRRRRRAGTDPASQVQAVYEVLWNPDDPETSKTLPHRRREGGRFREDKDTRRAYRKVAYAWEVARLKNHLPASLLGLAFLGLVVSAAASVETMWHDLPSVLGEISETPDPGSSGLFADIGTYTLIAMAGALLLLGRRALRGRDTRRVVNVVWDVVSFWPHSAHPFVPPAYSQTAVPDLWQRIRFHLGELDVRPADGTADHVVVAAHSQGSLIAFASLLWLDHHDLGRVGLVTHGSQLQVAFPRAFPAYIDYALIQEMYVRLDTRWVNLFRDTDPIAGPVLAWDRTAFTEPAPSSSRIDGTTAQADVHHRPTGRRESGHDWCLLDPTPTDNDRMLAPLMSMGKHSDYARSPDWQDALDVVRPTKEPRVSPTYLPDSSALLPGGGRSG